MIFSSKGERMASKIAIHLPIMANIDENSNQFCQPGIASKPCSTTLLGFGFLFKLWLDLAAIAGQLNKQGGQR